MTDDLDVLSRLVDYHDHIAAPLVPLADDLRRGRRGVRRHRGLLAGGVALALVSVVAAGSMFTSGRSADLPQPAHSPALTTPLVASLAVLVCCVSRYSQAKSKAGGLNGSERQVASEGTRDRSRWRSWSLSRSWKSRRGVAESRQREADC